LESMPTDPSILASANWWFDRSWYGLLIAGALTALAATATVIFLFVQFWSSGVRERHTEWRTSALELQAEEARKDTATALRDAAKANEATENLRAQNLSLTAQIAPRRLSKEQQVSIGKSLVAFTGKRVRMESYGLDTESAIFGRQIGSALSLARIDLDDALMSKISGGAIVLGVHVTGDDKELVSALLAALSSAGVLTSPEPFPTHLAGVTMGIRPTVAPAANVFVGIKPITQ
jgi:hypothetical protein